MTVPLVLLHRFGILSSELCRKRTEKRLTLVTRNDNPNQIDKDIKSNRIGLCLFHTEHSFKIVYIPLQSFTKFNKVI